MTKAPISTEKLNFKVTAQNATKKFVYITIADGLYFCNDLSIKSFSFLDPTVRYKLILLLLCLAKDH